MKLRFIIALWGAKLSQPVLKLTKHNGTNFPGALALKICPDFLKYVAKPERIIAVTGTNGKTTVSNLVCDLLEKSGHRILNNRAGSNIDSGISTALMNGVSLFNRPKYDTAVLEVDERSSKKIYPWLTPSLIVITNLFRDSIMRNAHPQYIADFLTDSIPSSVKLLLNADDLISSSVAPNNPRVYFGLAKMDTDVKECVNLLNDIRICPRCSGELKYEYRRYHHIGKAYCARCDFKSPDYDYTGCNIDLDTMTMTIRDNEGNGTYHLPSDSVFNIYNLVTTVAVGRELGMGHEEISECLRQSRIVDSRYNEERAGNVTIVMQMSKGLNALASSRAFDYVAGQPGQKELFLMMNDLNDERNWSENTAWLYDCDFEFLNKDDITHIVCVGPRRFDYRLRLLLAGVPEDRITCVRDEFMGTESLRFQPGTKIYMFYGADSLGLVYRVRNRIKELAEKRAE